MADIIDKNSNVSRPKAVISYSTADTTAVELLQAHLTDWCIDVWRDQTALQPGNQWLEEIAKVIDERPIIVLCFGAKLGNFQSGEVALAFLRHAEKLVVPVLLPGGIEPTQLPAYAQTRHAQDLRHIDLDKSEARQQHLAKLVYMCLCYGFEPLPDDEQKGWIKRLDGDNTNAATTVVELQSELRKPRTDSADRILRPGVLLANSRYELKFHLGEGGFAEVWKAMDHKYNRYVAIRVLRSSDEEKVKLFRNGARAMASITALGLAGVVRLYDAPEQLVNGHYIHVVEYIEGGNLADQVRGGRTLDLPTVLRIMESVCTTVARLHKQGFFHCDIAMENILLTAGGEPVPLLVDFDLVRFAATVVESGHSRAFGKVVYGAPELAEAKNGSPQADVYSLGAVTTRLFYGKEMSRLFPLDLKPFDELQTRIGKLATDVLRKACDVDPDKRYSDAKKFFQEFRNALELPPTPTSSTSATESGSRPSPTAVDRTIYAAPSYEPGGKWSYGRNDNPGLTQIGSLTAEARGDFQRPDTVNWEGSRHTSRSEAVGRMQGDVSKWIGQGEHWAREGVKMFLDYTDNAYKDRFEEAVDKAIRNGATYEDVLKKFRDS